VALIVDTSVLIAAERATGSVAQVAPADSRLAVSAVTLIELQRGVERAASAQRRRRREAFLREVQTLETLPVDATVALVGARVWVDLERQGTPIPVFDLLIAATALAGERPLLTADVRHFSQVEGLELRVVKIG
jgi:predicted nucleic acid-binding protein